MIANTAFLAAVTTFLIVAWLAGEFRTEVVDQLLEVIDETEQELFTLTGLLRGRG